MVWVVLSFQPFFWEGFQSFIKLTPVILSICVWENGFHFVFYAFIGHTTNICIHCEALYMYVWYSKVIPLDFICFLKTWQIFFVGCDSRYASNLMNIRQYVALLRVWNDIRIIYFFLILCYRIKALSLDVVSLEIQFRADSIKAYEPKQSK